MSHHFQNYSSANSGPQQVSLNSNTPGPEPDALVDQAGQDPASRCKLGNELRICGTEIFAESGPHLPKRYPSPVHFKRSISREVPGKCTLQLI